MLWNYNISFFFFLSINFVLFFSRQFSAISSISSILLVAHDFIYVIFLLCWVRYLETFMGMGEGKSTKNVILVAGILYGILWIIVYAAFTNQSGHVVGGMGKALALIAEVVLLISTVGCTIFYLYPSIKMHVSQKKTYLFIIATPMMIYFVGFFLYDVDAIFGLAGPQKWMWYPFDMVILLSILVNIVNIVFFYPKLILGNEPINDEFVKGSIDKISQQFLLTAREKEVVCQIYKGYTNSDIAEQLTISMYTVKRHINNIFKKLDIKNRAELIDIVNIQSKWL